MLPDNRATFQLTPTIAQVAQNGGVSRVKEIGALGGVRLQAEFGNVGPRQRGPESTSTLAIQEPKGNEGVDGIGNPGNVVL